MHESAIFNFHPYSLVRMSRDDIIDQYKIYPIVNLGYRYKIGYGNDAVVYKAKYNFEGGKWRAVKKIHRSYIDREEYLQTEIYILKRLDHPGVLKIFYVFDDLYYVFIVTELCEGNSLLQEIKKRGRFSYYEAREVFRKILYIVSYCHQNKIIHRDLKLYNLVYCTQNSTPYSLRLIDFGMAFYWKSNSRKEIKSTFYSNKIVGTIYYMAPYIRNETYDHRVDIWSCGVLLYALLTGCLPFGQEYDDDIIEAIYKRKVCYEKLKKRKCSYEAIDLLKKIFVTYNKRLSIEYILAHPWMKTYHQDHHSLNQREYFSLINLTYNWKNFFEFLSLDEIEKAIKIYLTYRLSHEKSNRYRKIFDHFKCTKNGNILLHTMHDLLQRSIKQDESTVEVKRIDYKLMTFLDQNKYRTVSYIMFLTWICDYYDFDKSYLDFLRGKLRNKSFQDEGKRIDVINDEIQNIHKIIRQSYLEKKEKCKSYSSHTTSSVSTGLSNLQKPSLLTINVKKINEYYKVLLKRPSKKSIKQNIFESISPTFLKSKKTNLNEKIPIQIKQQSKGSRLLYHHNEDSSFMFGIRKMISFF